MFQTNFYQELIDKYFENINPPPHHQELAKIGGPISQYLADQNNDLINMIGNNSNRIVDLDITSAFPTICHNLFNNDSQFIQTLDTIPEKRNKNIFIATKLKGEPLKQINQICKLVIIGTIFDSDNKEELENILILELKKDGCLISCPPETLNRLQNLNSIQSNFTKFILENKFAFHFDEYSKYVRSNRTSFLLNKTLDNLIIKGHYKHVPTKLKTTMIEFLLNNFKNLEIVNKVYTQKYFKILQKNNLTDTLNRYYICEKNKVIDQNGKYVSLQYNTKVNPQLYKKLFLHPLLI